MKLGKKKSLHHKVKQTEKIIIESVSRKSLCEIKFSEYIGQVVTVYVDAGGLVGNGFTGILIDYKVTYIRILVLPSLPPSCSLSNGCKGNTDNILLCLSCPFNENASLGSVAEICISSIVALVHSNLKLSSRRF